VAHQGLIDKESLRESNRNGAVCREAKVGNREIERRVTAHRVVYVMAKRVFDGQEPMVRGKGRAPSQRRLSAAALFGASISIALLGAAHPAVAASNGPQLEVLAGTAGLSGLPISGPALASHFNNPAGVAVDTAGNVYVADYRNDVVEKITPAGELSIVAGNGSQGAPTAGPATSSPLDGPQGVAVDRFGNIYIAEWGTVDKVDQAGMLSVIAGQPGQCGNPVPGPAIATQLCNLASIAVDTSGNVFVAALGNSLVVKITPTGYLGFVAGTGSTGAPTPGAATYSALNQPMGVAVGPDGVVYIADAGNNVVEKVTADGVLSIVAGTGATGTPSPGPATSSKLDAPVEVALDSQGNLYIDDMFNQTIEEVDPSGDLKVIAGQGLWGPPTAGPALQSRFSNPVGLTVDAQGYVYVGDYWNFVVEKISDVAPAAPPSDVHATSSGRSHTISWSPPTYLGGATITSYRVTASPGGASCVTTTTSCTISGLSDGAPYTFTVTATNAVGTSDPSAPSTATVPTLPSTGSNIKDLLWLSSGLITAGFVTLASQRRRSTTHTSHAGVARHY
jgi:Fibronectin type III domain/NHL repeat